MPQRECRGCGVVFRPVNYTQHFHDVPCREDATVRNRHAKALEKAERSGWKTSERTCRGCRLVFQPRYVGQIYHNIPCRNKTHNRDQSAKRWRAKEEQERAGEEAEKLELLAKWKAYRSRRGSTGAVDPWIDDDDDDDDCDCE